MRGFTGGFLTSLLVGLVAYGVIAATGLASHAWAWWAGIGIAMVAGGVVIEIRAGDKSPLFGQGLATGALMAFGGVALAMLALGLEFGG